MKHQSKSKGDFTIIDMKLAAESKTKMFIDSKCIMTHGHFIHKTHLYLLTSVREDHRIKFNLVTWFDNVNRDGTTHFIFEDVFSHRLLWLDHDMAIKKKCRWMLMDSDHIPQMQAIIEYILIGDYCSC